MDIETASWKTRPACRADAVVTHGEMMRTFEALQGGERRALDFADERGGDVLLEEKVARIDAALDAHERRLDEIDAEDRAAARSAATTRGAHA